jgi:ribosome maturation factor RimP
VPQDGRKRFRGIALGADAETVRMKLDEGGEASFPRSNIRRAKLVLTDDLIKATAAASGADSAEDEDTEATGSPGAEGAKRESDGKIH